MKKKRFKLLLIAITIIFVAAGICSCTKKIYVPVESVRTEYIDRMQRDSIYVLDSVRIVDRNDTVFLYKYKTELKYRILSDSIFVKDTIREPYAVEKIVKVEKSLSMWQTICIKGFTALLLLVAGYLLITYRKKVGSVIMWLIKKVI